MGKLYNKYSSDTLNDNLNILGISDEQFNIFEIVISNAKSYYKDSQSFNEAVTNGYHWLWKEELDIYLIVNPRKGTFSY